LRRNRAKSSTHLNRDISYLQDIVGAKVPIKVLNMDLLKKDATRISASTGCNSFIEEMVRQVKDYRLAKRVREDQVRVSMA
jgi:hypothetical protein